MTSLVPIPQSGLPSRLQADIDRAVEFAKLEKSPATRRAYRSDVAIFRSWCDSRGVSALPALPETVAAFLASEAERGITPSTIARRVAAIRYAHKLAGHLVPTEDERVKATVRGHRRAVGTAPRKKAPATAERIIAMAMVPGTRMKDLRDRALLLLGFAGAFRRSELVALDVADLEETDAGLKITIRKSKTDQDGLGCTIAIVRGSIACPVAALKTWLDAAEITDDRGHRGRNDRHLQRCHRHARNESDDRDGAIGARHRRARPL